MKKYIIVFTAIIVTAFSIYYYQVEKQQNEKRATLFKIARKHASYTKPRSTFMIHRAPETKEGSVAVVVEVVGPFDTYQYQWILPSGVVIREGDVTGTVNAVEKKVFTHEVSLDNVNTNDQIIFEAYTIENGVKMGATHIYSRADVAPETNEIQSFGKSKVDKPNVKVMQ